jgi:hypothetical protein
MECQWHCFDRVLHRGAAKSTSVAAASLAAASCTAGWGTYCCSARCCAGNNPQPQASITASSGPLEAPSQLLVGLQHN